EARIAAAAQNGASRATAATDAAPVSAAAASGSCALRQPMTAAVPNTAAVAAHDPARAGLAGTAGRIGADGGPFAKRPPPSFPIRNRMPSPRTGITACQPLQGTPHRLDAAFRPQPLGRRVRKPRLEGDVQPAKGNG